jgi:hypothetical protein
MKVCLSPQKDVKIAEKGPLVCVPPRIRVAIEDEKFGLSLNVKVRFDIYASKGTKL